MKYFYIFCFLFCFESGFCSDQIIDIGEQYLTTVFESFDKNDYSTYCTHMSQKIKEEVTEVKFKTILESIKGKMGKVTQRTYLGFLNQDNMKVLLWKGRFDKTNNDVLIKLVLMEVDGTYLIAGLWFQ